VGPSPGGVPASSFCSRIITLSARCRNAVSRSSKGSGWRRGGREAGFVGAAAGFTAAASLATGVGTAGSTAAGGSAGVRTVNGGGGSVRRGGGASANGADATSLAARAAAALARSARAAARRACSAASRLAAPISSAASSAPRAVAKATSIRPSSSATVAIDVRGGVRQSSAVSRSVASFAGEASIAGNCEYALGGKNRCIHG
jgi:hypothetical protein